MKNTGANYFVMSCPWTWELLCFVANFVKSQAEMPQKELTIAERVVVLRKIREQPPNISHRQLAEITGVPRTTLAQILQDFE